MSEQKQFTFNNVGIKSVIDEIEALCKEKKLSKREKYFRCLIGEEILGLFLEHCKDNKEYSEDSVLKFSRLKRLDGSFIKIAIKGKMFNPIEEFSNENNLLNIDDVDSAAAFRCSILVSQKENISYKYQNGYNCIYICVKKKETTRIMKVVYAMLLSAIVGVALRYVGNESVLNGLDYYLFVPIKTLFLNALKMVMVPVVFFSIVTCVNGFSNIKELGKTSTKILSFYGLTTCFALAVGSLTFLALKPGSNATGLRASASGVSIDSITQSSAQTDISILNTITSIIPADLIAPITNANMLQVIFVAIMVGISLNMLGSSAKVLQDLFVAGNDLFLKMTSIFIEAIPLATFCSLTSVIMKVGVESLGMLMFYLLTFMVGLSIMMCVYVMLMIILCRVNPIKFLKKSLSYITIPLSLGSSNAAVPMTIEFCTKKLGISPKIASFSVPIGSTINMDGTCIMLIIGSLFLANVYGVAITGASMLAFLVSAFILSIGAPGIPGAGLICISVLLLQLGVPVEGVGIIMGIDQICGMLRTASNVMGDISASFVVAKLQNDVDMEMYLR